MLRVGMPSRTLRVLFDPELPVVEARLKEDDAERL
jgi:hypothetical protein